MRVIFLDFDGVLNTHAYLVTMKNEDPIGEAAALDPAAVARVNKIIEATGAVVVVSSSWRYGRTVGYLEEMLVSRGFKGKVVGTTPEQGAGPQRGDEIRAWVNTHPEVESFVVLDDDSDMEAVRQHFIKTYWNREDGGLQDHHIDRAIKILIR